MYLTLTRVPKAPDAQDEPMIINSRHIVAILPNPAFKHARCEIVITTGQHIMVKQEFNHIVELLDTEVHAEPAEPIWPEKVLDSAALNRIDLETAAMDRAKGEF